MKMQRKMFAIILCALMVSLMMIGCGKASAGGNDDTSNIDSTGKEIIKLAIRSDGIDQVEIVRPHIEALGYELEVLNFDDSIQPNVALVEGSVDINWYQHEPYMKNYNESNNTNIVMVEPTTAYPLFAMYSDKHTAISEIPDGGKIGLCNDSSNQVRGLKLLEEQGLITLDETVEVPTIYDVKENPHHLELIEAEMSLLPQSISDCDAICLAAVHMGNAGLSTEGYLCESSDSKRYAVGFAVRAEDKDAPWASEIAKAVQCDELAEYYKTEKQGTLIPMWE